MILKALALLQPPLHLQNEAKPVHARGLRHGIIAFIFQFSDCLYLVSSVSVPFCRWENGGSGLTQSEDCS